MSVANSSRALTLTLMLTLTGCAGLFDTSSSARWTSDARADKLSAPDDCHGKSRTYELKGKFYWVKDVPVGYMKTGTASWYGKPFHGRKTASGERFDMYQVSAAHKTLPLFSIVRVTNLENGKEIAVRINDRGPFKGKRLIDLSYAAAKKLGMVSDGVALVRMTVVKTPSDDGMQTASLDSFGLELLGTNLLRIR